MSHSRYFGGLIWTNHAIERLTQRGLTQSMAAQAYHAPDKTFHQKDGAIEYQKRLGNASVTLIAKQNDKNEWIVLSTWMDPPLPGSLDWKKRENYRKYQKAGFWGKIWITFKQQLGF